MSVGSDYLGRMKALFYSSRLFNKSKRLLGLSNKSKRLLGRFLWGSVVVCAAFLFFAFLLPLVDGFPMASICGRISSNSAQRTAKHFSPPSSLTKRSVSKKRLTEGNSLSEGNSDNRLRSSAKAPDGS